MSEPYLGEIKLLAFNFPPKGWALCNGQLMPINQNQALFALLGTSYGGNGQTTFALPNLQGRVPIHTSAGTGITLGMSAGESAVALAQSQMPPHVHPLMASSAEATVKTPDGGVWAAPAVSAYHSWGPSGGGDNRTEMSPAALTAAGGSQRHTNMQPYLVLNYCIALTGIFPSQN
ncbi:phage tail protein [Paenibacillus sambharensis]|uniref:Phage tail protein n=1 Tax=Paenibacillus sambharensis TaxID=1803190 RepID=A0A2W1L6E1_9BACL|nr:tail fiber protein [Paenibacillus sambharensis]PZD94523.1 phage tail protein [Paenibacillus sambharensis]